MYRVRLFNLGMITGLFNKEKLIACISEGASGGFRMLRREFRIEPRRVLIFLKAPSFGLVFKRDEENEEIDYNWRVGQYATRFFTRTVDTAKINEELNRCAGGGYELFYAMKYPCRFLFLFPREAYFFIFRKPIEHEAPSFSYHVHQTPYRFFSSTVDPDRYEGELNQNGHDSELKITFRDEKRLLGVFTQPTAVSIWETYRG